MGKEKRRYDSQFKASVALEALRGDSNVFDLAKRHALHPSLVHAWRKRLIDAAPSLLGRTSRDGELTEALREKERHIERLAAENAWLCKVAQTMSVEDRRAAVEMDNPPIPVIRQVRLLSINRSGIYYRMKRRADSGDPLAIADAEESESMRASGD